MATWPSILELPPHRDAFSLRPTVSVVAFQSEVGNGKRRQRSTLDEYPQTWATETDAAGYALFLEFFNTDCKRGALPFTRVDPLTQVSSSYLFDAEDPWSLRGAGGDLYIITVNVVQQPT